MARISLGRVRAARAKEEADGASWEIMDKSIKKLHFRGLRVFKMTLGGIKR